MIKSSDNLSSRSRGLSSCEHMKVKEKRILTNVFSCRGDVQMFSCGDGQLLCLPGNNDADGNNDDDDDCTECLEDRD